MPLHINLINKNQLGFSSKDVFSERKNGDLQKAYEMACQLVEHNPNDEWNQKALAWCLISLIKQNPLDEYVEKLKQIPDSAIDEVLEKSIYFALQQANPFKTEINQAKALSKAGQHRDAANIYFKILKSQPNNIELQTAFAWELYHLSQEVLKQALINVENIKRYFFEYFKLSTEKPSLLHHCFLNIALRLIENDKIDKKQNIDFVAFCLQWNFNNLKWEDYNPRHYQDNNGKEHTIQPLALTVFRLVLQNAIERNNRQALNELVNFIESKLQKINGDIIWLQWDLAKSYHFLNDNKSALNIVMPILKSKPNEFWLWDFLGDIYFSEDQNIALACYCKALLKQKDINFVAKIKMKLVYYFIHQEEFDRAKTELQQIIDYKQAHSQRITDEIQQFRLEPWFQQASCLNANTDFYLQFIPLAEQLLYQDLPWIYAVLGGTFEHNSKLNRKLFIQTGHIPTEISVPENRINLANKKADLPIQIKGEWTEGKFQIYVTNLRNDNLDIFNSYLAIIDHINNEKGLVHLLISEKIDCTISKNSFPFDAQLYKSVSVKLSQHRTKDGKLRYKIHHIMESTKQPENLIKEFNVKIKVNNGMGFGIDSDLFFAPTLVQEFELKDDDLVRGKAIRSFDKKKNAWSWKVIEIW
ncbi:hypothetical protein GVX76_10260 [[Haemophilus] felis]|nr:hypothetical protein [[Haemophilus] felis]